MQKKEKESSTSRPVLSVDSEGGAALLLEHHVDLILRLQPQRLGGGVALDAVVSGRRGVCMYVCMGVRLFVNAQSA